MLSNNYYDVLKVGQAASYTEIRLAYKKLVQKHHPDKHNGSRESELKMMELNEAYKILSEADSRYAYDLKLHLKRQRIMESTRPKKERDAQPKRQEPKVMSKPKPQSSSKAGLNNNVKPQLDRSKAVDLCLVVVAIGLIIYMLIIV